MHLDGWTLLLQAINLLVLLVLLRWLFFQPVRRIIEARRHSVEEQLQEAAKARSEVEARAHELDREQVSFEGARQKILDEAHQAAEAERGTAREQGCRAAEAALAEARERIRRERGEARQALLREAAELAVSLAARLLATSAPASDARFVDALLDELARRPPGEVAALFDGSRSVLVATAHPLDQETREHVHARLATLLHDAGASVQAVFEVHTALIAGAELRFPHGVMSMSWASELAAAREQLDAAGAAHPA